MTLARASVRNSGTERKTQWRSRARLAREFYAKRHLAKLVALRRAEVVDQLSPWLERAIDATLEWDEPGEQRRFLKRMVRSQYLVTVEQHRGGTPIVDGHPNEEVLYGDLYEMSASGSSAGGIGNVKLLINA